jgi:Mn-containing catalase
MATIQTLSDALTWQLETLAGSEQQLRQRLPRIARQAHHAALTHCLDEFLQRLRDDEALLRDCFHLMQRTPSLQPCEATAAMLDQVESAIDHAPSMLVRDALMAATLRRLFHAEIAVCTTCCEWADQLGRHETTLLLQQMLADARRIQQRLVAISHELEGQSPAA